MQLPFFLAKRFVAAETLEGAVPIVNSLRDKGLSIALDMLGEYVSDRSVASRATESYIHILDTIAALPAVGGTDIHASIKLSMLGQRIDPSFCRDNLYRLLETAKKHGQFVCCDMEGSDLTESTISIFTEAHQAYPENVGIVLQAYLHRTQEDVDRMCEMKARVRICKGAYKEPAELAWQDMEKIRERYLEYAKQLITSSRFPGIATHDDRLLLAVAKFVDEESIPADQFEYQMLFGIRPDTQARIAESGSNMRVYVPYGTDWLPYYTRRLRERKENVWFLLKHLFSR